MHRRFTGYIDCLLRDREVGECDWVLPFVVESEESQKPDGMMVAMEEKNPRLDFCVFGEFE